MGFFRPTVLTVSAVIAVASIAVGQTDSRSFWTDLGPHNGSDARSLVLEKMGHEIGSLEPASAVYVGTSDDGIFESSDQGSTWAPFNAGLPDRSITALAIAQKEIQLGAPEIVYETALYAGTAASGLFLYESQWTQVRGGLNGSRVFAIAAASTDIVYVATEAGLFRTSDGGFTWISIGNGLPMGQVTVLAFDPHSGKTVFAGIGSQVFRSLNGGETWTSVFSESETSISTVKVAPFSSQVIFVGTTPGGPVLAIPELPGEVFRSTDGGESWTNLTDPWRGLPGDLVEAFEFEETASTVYVGTWGDGVFRSADLGDTWALMTSGLTDFYISTLALDSSTHTSLYAGTVPNGYLSGGPVFKLETLLGPPREPQNRFTHTVPFRGPR